MVTFRFIKLTAAMHNINDEILNNKIIMIYLIINRLPLIAKDPYPCC